MAAEPITGRATVIDADTIEIRGRRIRLHGIYAPESRQLCKLDGKPWRCGKDAAFALADKVGAANVHCDPVGQDKYQRVLAVCRLRGNDLNGWLVRQGWALAYRRYSKDYIGAEDEAREHKRGIWRSEFVPPWEWRKRQRALADPRSRNSATQDSDMAFRDSQSRYGVLTACLGRLRISNGPRRQPKKENPAA